MNNKLSTYNADQSQTVFNTTVSEQDVRHESNYMTSLSHQIYQNTQPVRMQSFNYLQHQSIEHHSQTTEVNSNQSINNQQMTLPTNESKLIYPLDSTLSNQDHFKIEHI